MLGTPVDDRLRARRLLQRAEDPAVAPSRREMLPGDHRVPPAKPVAEHTCCLPHADGREPPIGTQGLPAGRQDASRNRSGGDRRRIWLVAAALICCPQLTDRSEPQAMPELPELPRWAPDPGVIGEKKFRLYSPPDWRFHAPDRRTIPRVSHLVLHHRQVEA
ncbi:hypothetical protein WJX75_005170 [Coccomyxa subellipsoidea]|uniref:Uncharacterized protein n=1 Tax=Coccomyxa subellipsoidea TaxID=248742 RepID=A0ABR2YQS0_9CHLO